MLYDSHLQELVEVIDRHKERLRKQEAARARIGPDYLRTIRDTAGWESFPDDLYTHPPGRDVLQEFSYLAPRCTRKNFTSLLKNKRPTKNTLMGINALLDQKLHQTRPGRGEKRKNIGSSPLGHTGEDLTESGGDGPYRTLSTPAAQPSSVPRHGLRTPPSTNKVSTWSSHNVEPVSDRPPLLEAQSQPQPVRRRGWPRLSSRPDPCSCAQQVSFRPFLEAQPAQRYRTA